MEFLRFGSRIPGAYRWGCCAVCIIQNFSQDPDAPASVQLVSGDSGMPILTEDGEEAFLGYTNREIFLQRLRIGTFSSDDMPNHVFLAVMTADQLSWANGKARKWLQILKENGFEFIRATDNSVYTGHRLQREIDNTDEDELFYADDTDQESHVNYIFGLFRNIGCGRISDPFEPPQAWKDLDSGITDVSQHLSSETRQTLEKERYDLHLSHWDKIGPTTKLTRAQLQEKNVPVTLAGMFSDFPQELEDLRKERLGQMEKSPQEAKKLSPWKI